MNMDMDMDMNAVEVRSDDDTLKKSTLRTDRYPPLLRYRYHVVTSDTGTYCNIDIGTQDIPEKSKKNGV
jgi:hypothetical protein